MEEDDSQQFSLRWHNHQVDTLRTVLSEATLFLIIGHTYTNGEFFMLAYSLMAKSETAVCDAVLLSSLILISSVIGALGRMLTTGALSDVTLSAGGASLRAHRLVLAACSQYFAQLFKEVDTENNTVVVVLGCEVAELRLLLTFMYTGEVTASRRRLPALLRLAHTLQVSGLTDADTNSNIHQPLPETNNEAESPINLEKPPLQPDFDAKETREVDTNKLASEIQNKETEYINEVVGRNEKDKLSKLDQIVQNLYSTHRIGNFMGSIATQPLSTISSLAGPPEYDKRWRSSSSVCTVCNKRLSNQYNLRVHMETHAGRRHACRACSHVSRSRDALRKHVAYRHAAHRATP